MSESVADAVARRLEEVEVRLSDAVSHTDDLADSVSRHLVEAGGKRFRPLLTLLAAELGDGADERVVAAAAGVELTHLASLYHDDVMDEAAVRRGAPSANSRYTNTVAIGVAATLVLGVFPQPFLDLAGAITTAAP